MTEGEFVRFYKKRNNSKSHKEVREKIDLFWNVLLKALDEDKKVIKFRAGKSLIEIANGDIDE